MHEKEIWNRGEANIKEEGLTSQREEVFITQWQRLAGICISLSSAPASAGWRRKERRGKEEEEV